MDLNIRLRKISLTNFRNIEHAVVDIPGGRITDLLNCKPSILGIYGQNGSGKSSLLMAISTLKAALCGFGITGPSFASCIRCGCEYAHLEFEFSACNKSGTEYDIFYSFKLRHHKPEECDIANEEDVKEYLKYSGFGSLFSEKANETLNVYLRPYVEVFDELVQYSSKSKSGKKTNKQVLIDTSEKACKASGRSFGNKVRYEQLTAKAKNDIHEKLDLYKKYTTASAMSFIFADPIVSLLVTSCNIVIHKRILKSLVEYGKNYLFVISSHETAQNGMKILPMAIWFYDKNNKVESLVYPLLLLDHCKCLEPYFPQIYASIPLISNLITKVVPGLTIEIDDIGKTAIEGQEFHVFDLFSVRNHVRIPLAYESEGIRRIISFILLLSAAYNNPSVTIAIDEIDSGIFEYMLGELLSIMKDFAKGQLIFTSHNLHPLDKNYLPYKNLLFTTTDPDNMFVKLEGVSGNNNLRDKYFSLIKNANSFYNPTSRESIEQALIEASKPILFQDGLE